MAQMVYPVNVAAPADQGCKEQLVLWVQWALLVTQDRQLRVEKPVCLAHKDGLDNLDSPELPDFLVGREPMASKDHLALPGHRDRLADKVLKVLLDFLEMQVLEDCKELVEHLVERVTLVRQEDQAL